MDKEQFNHMDDWFREAADQPGPPMPETAWKDMERLLDQNEKKRRRILFWWWSGLVLIGALVYFLEKGDHTRPAVLPQASNETVTGKPDQPASKSSAAANGQKKASSLNEPATLKSVPQSLPVDRSESDPSATPDGNANGDHPAASASASSDNARLKKGSDTGATTAAGQHRQKSRDAQGRQRSGHQAGQLTKTENPANGNRSVKEATGLWELDASLPGAVTAQAGSGYPAGTPEYPLSSPRTLPLPPVDKNLKKKSQQQDPIKNRWFVYAGGGLERSFVPGNSLGSTAWGGGFGAGYRFAQKWYVQSGLTFFHKIYDADGSDYHPPDGSYLNQPGVDLIDVEADCFVMEWPILLRYDFLQKKQYRVYATAGIQSAQMKSETYNYDYTKDGNRYYYKHTYETGKFKFANAISLGAGGEWQVMPRLHIQLYPSVTIPVSGVGEGNVKIGALNVQAGVRYQLPF
ncbi:porin family protein [Flavihumibacter petaseus]|uniref:Outer membrane protein beta-barrel domain-containing protein n=1 Tax=Flavihumibacter petaseus NBRC 106054 TaxID=1220578 RepID=A0A0E9N1K3_9BACT|nr:porin family protein [Flavihumibacter petaseus]GAO43897.1 hypothetical protein FPE01S_02_10030 [Flavihumibacter petaseus NBRC 106054]